MSESKTLQRLVRPLAKGQITLPAEFRRRLRIDETTILRVSLKGSKIEILPIRVDTEEIQTRDYSQDDIARFLREDRLDAKTASRVRRLLRKRE